MRLAEAPAASLPAVPPPFAPPLLPQPAQPAPHARLAYARESSLSPARAASQRRFSHSRGRPRGVGLSTERSASRSNSDWNDAGSGWRDRSESRDGSRAPLCGTPFIAASRGGSIKSDGKAAPTMDGEEGQLRAASEEDKGLWAVRLARHFCGIRDRRALRTPLVRPLRHLSPTTEGYLLAFLGSFPSILIACGIALGLSSLPSGAFDATPLTVGSLGATAVLVYAIPEGPLSQPRNVVGGHLVSALTGAIISQLFALSSRFETDLASDNTLASADSWESLTPVAAALAVSLAIFAMQVTGTVHPPGGATALIAAYHRTTAQRWTYVLDVVLSVSAMGLWGMVVNNLGRRRYPAYWWTPPPPDDAAVSSPHPGALSLPPAELPPPQPPGGGYDEGKKSTRRLSPEAHFQHTPPPKLSPSEDVERRWLGRLGEVDEEALAGGDEQAEREVARWCAAENEERGRRATRR
ncbi:hypothetical protein JCM3770_001140 [Rhodotorula araucariae]